MNSYSFFCYGHPNILGTHRNTFEFTKDKELTLEGDCIIGVKADFKVADLLDFLKNKKRIKIVMKVDELSEEVECEVSPCFYHNHEIVVRKTSYCSARTLGVNANKSSKELNREIIERMKIEGKEMVVEMVDY